MIFFSIVRFLGNIKRFRAIWSQISKREIERERERERGLRHVRHDIASMRVELGTGLEYV